MKTLLPGKDEQKEISKAIFSIVVPRPIAWISTISKEGVVNLAPFSFFNAVTTKPPIIMVSIGKRKDGTLKDTDRNIRETSEFVVNFVSEEFLEKMHLSGRDYPPNESEVEVLSVPTEPSKIVSPPKVKGVPAALECKLKEIVEIGDTPMSLIFGEVVAVHFEERLLKTSKGIVGRLGGKRYTIIDNEIDLSEL